MFTSNYLSHVSRVLRSILLSAVIGGGIATAAGQAQTSAPVAQTTHRILSCNIRVALPADAAEGVGWPQRKAICVQVMRNHHPDIMCLQEVLRVQAEDLESTFPEFQLFGFEGPEMDGLSDDYRGIAKNIILFKKERYELVAAGTYWLSETPLIGGSSSWDSARPRHANWVRLKEKATGKEFRILDTHLDHIAQGAREHQVAIIMTDAAQYAPDFPQILAGDFNANAGNPVYKQVMDAGWKDTWTLLHGAEDAGYTTHGFKGPKAERKKTPKPGVSPKIDFIFCHGNVTPIETSIIRDNVNGQYPSDHYFLSADLKL